MSQEVSVKLKGPQAILVILLLAGYGGFQWVRLGVNFVTGGPEPTVREWIAEAYFSSDLEDALDAAEENLSEDAAQKVLEAAAKRESLGKVEITKFSARKSGKDEYIVRVEFLLDGKAPPDGKGRRYLRLKKRSPGGWRVRRETSAFSFYSTLF
jgi:hypothetical protein